jgi:hypothetical protein
MSASFRTFASSGVSHVLFAMVVMGSWAVLANWDHSWGSRISAGLVQAALSGSLTLFLKTGIDVLSRRFRPSAARWAPPLVVCLVSAAILIAFHVMSGTPEITRTIALPLLVSTSYATIYSNSIFDRKRR